MTDNYVQIPPNSSGLKIDTSELTVNSQTVERQRIVLADPTASGNFVGVSVGGALQVSSDDVSTIQYLILGELRRIVMLLQILTGKTVSLSEVISEGST